MNKKRNLKREKRIKVVIFLVGLILLIYLPSMIFWIVDKNISTAMLDMGQIEDLVSASGVIVRDEEVLKASFGGKLVSDVCEGDKVEAGARFATILKAGAEEFSKDLNNIDLNILKIQKNNRKNEKFYSNDIFKIDNEISSRLKEAINDSNLNNIERVKNIKNDINLLIQKKVTIVSGITSTDTQLNSLKAKRDQYQVQINANTEIIYTSSSGIASYNIDGFEQVLNLNAIKAMDPDFFDKIKLNNKPNKSTEDITLQAAKPFAKLIKGIDYYIIIILNKDQSQGYKINDKIKVRINNIDKSINGLVYSKSEPKNDKIAIAIKTNMLMNEMVTYRVIDVDLIKNSFSGLIVPIKSLVDINETEMKAKIALVKLNTVKITDIKIVGKNNEYAIISDPLVSFKSNVNLYDTYVINPKNINEGQTIRK